MRRVLGVLGLVLVLGAWTCQAPPSGGGDGVAGMSTAGFAGLVGGEDWHYVGDTDEPAFENSWVNSGGGLLALAFRIRESGVIDIHGVVEGGAAGTVFTLPSGYRPSSTTASMPIVTSTGGVLSMTVAADGSVSAPTGSGKVGFAHQIFLNLPDPA